MVIENAINVYTDGSSLSHPRRGGIGIRLVYIDSSGKEKFQDVPRPGYPGATNNQMELQACIEGIKEAMHHQVFDNFYRIAVHSDSQYVVDNHLLAFYTWSKNRWCNYEGKPVDNAEFWKDLLKTVKKCGKPVDFYWENIKNKHHKAAHKLAGQSAKNAINPPLRVVQVRRKLSKQSVEPGCVQMKNQRISLRIIGDELLPQNIFKYRYEVISKGSPYYRKVDFIYSDILLKAGRCYSVRLNDDQEYPQIIKLFKELPKQKK